MFFVGYNPFEYVQIARKNALTEQVALREYYWLTNNQWDAEQLFDARTVMQRVHAITRQL